MTRPTPPAVPRFLLLRLAPRAIRSELEGDLLEGFHQRCQGRGLTAARWWYWRQLFAWDTLRLPAVHTGQVRPALPTTNEGRVVMSMHDLRYAGRALGRNKIYAVMVVLTLAIGIGANTAIFSVVNGVLLRPLPFSDPEQLTMVFRTVPRFGFDRSTVSYPDFVDWRDRAGSFSSMAAYASSAVTYVAAAGAERWNGYRNTADLFALLGAGARIGRTFGPDDDRPGAPPVVVLSHALWQGRFGGDTTIVGRSLTLEGEPVSVIGVMPQDFAFPGRTTDFWMPLRADATVRERDSNFLTVIARRRSEVTLSAAQTEMTTLAQQIDRSAEGANEGFGVFLEARHAFVVRNARTGLIIFQVAVLLVLVLACANVANLMLARATGRRRELAVRAALGADRIRLTREMLTESALLSVVGGIVGVVGAFGLLRLLRAFGTAQLPRLDEVGIDLRVLGITALVTLGCGVVCGLAPAAFAWSTDLGRSMKEGGQGAGIGRGGRRLRGGLVTTQVALAVMLTIAAGLLANSFIRLTAVQPGFDPSNVVAARVTVPELEMPRDMERDEMMALFMSWAGARSQFYEELVRRVAALPGVQEVGLAFGLPFFPAYSFSRVVVPEGLIVEPGEEPVVSGNVIAGSYLEAMGIAVRKGRGFDATDVRESLAVITVNEVMADLFWPGEDAIGKQIALGGADGTPVTVVGVVANVRQRSLAEDEPPMYYRPLAQAGWPDGMFVVVRTDGDPAGAVSSIRQQLWSLNPELPLTDVSVATQLIDRSVAAPRFRAALLVTFSAFALLLSLVGIYGVIAYNVGERTHEMGVRMALGAQGATIVAMVVGQGLRLVAIGIAAGVLGSWGLTRFLRGMLFGVTGTDGLTFGATAVVFVTIAILASYGPARRAARADPLESLRSE